MARQRKARHRNRLWAAIFGLLACACIAAGVSAYLPEMFVEPEDGPQLTHTIERGELRVTVTEQGTLESSNNSEVKCRVRGFSTVTWVIPAGTVVEKGAELVRLDTKVVEEQYSLTKTNTYIATATLEESRADVAKAEIAIEAYEKGRYIQQVQLLQKQLQAAQNKLMNAEELHASSENLFRQGIVTDLQVDANSFAVLQARLELKVKETEIKVLEEFTKKMQMETLKGNLTASRSKLAADEAGLAMETKRRDRAKEELDACVIRADKAGLVIYPSAAAWKRTPDITEGATVRKDQVLLLMPDLTKMQVKVGIHESIIERMQPGLKAIITLPDRTIESEVTKVASVTRPAGWWTGNVVKYDTVIELPSDKGLKPGMSAEVEVELAVYPDVLKIPVAAVIEDAEGSYCWVKTEQGISRRILQLGDSNDVFVIVERGVKEGDQVILNPTAIVDEAKDGALTTFERREAPSDDGSGSADLGEAN